eukprot:3765653-Rhodomonas_salina.2
MLFASPCCVVSAEGGGPGGRAGSGELDDQLDGELRLDPATAGVGGRGAGAAAQSPLARGPRAEWRLGAWAGAGTSAARTGAGTPSVGR